MLASPMTARILLAEDDPALRSLLATALATDGYDVVQAADGREVIQLLACSLAEEEGERPVFDLIVSDVHMSGWSGLEILAGLSRYPAPPPVVLITAFGDERMHADARRLGAVATLDKPFDVDDLRAVVSHTLREARTRA
jgi:DNA-binding response OmpR family regulator